MEWDDRPDGELGYDEDDALDDSPSETGPGDPYNSPDARRGGPSPLVVVLLLLLAAGLGVGAWWLFGRAEPADPAPWDPPAADDQASAPDPVVPASADEEEALDLPPLSASDAFIRDVARRLSEHPRLVEWLAREDLVRRFVVAVDAAARGEVAREQLKFLKPSESFKVDRLPDGRWLAETDNPSRYDAFFEVVGSVEPEVAATLYRQLEPLFDEAYREIGRPGTTFRERMRAALARVEAVDYPEGPFEVQTVKGNFVFVDPALEGASDLEKQLWRMGPERRAQLQRFVDALRAEIG